MMILCNSCIIVYVAKINIVTAKSLRYEKYLYYTIEQLMFKLLFV
ncbi:hypothetical protein PEPS_46490 (plasmid) [Persicobacter psychrovividus]|uniref:Uncharacterized protein n=1 Tax=Persicobacter psychrovividus TaxID=387638 RepID=A0ABM7VN20_9BACT|nr:hypothetical protein PEPS_46490 [Persicobacter psychrovividus]